MRIKRAASTPTPGASGKTTKLHNQLGRAIARMTLAISIVAGLILAEASSAQAVTVRPGAGFGQVDVMLDAYETEQVRRSFWAATVTCWDAGVAGKLLGLGPCQTMVTVCAARAYYSVPRKRAGITFAPGTAWCWKY